MGAAFALVVVLAVAFGSSLLLQPASAVNAPNTRTIVKAFMVFPLSKSVILVFPAVEQIRMRDAKRKRDTDEPGET